MWWMNLIIIVLGYLIGTINPAYIFGKLKGIDIRTKGSKNAGATNAWHVLGKPYGIITALFDLSKGVLVIWMVLLLTHNTFSNIPAIAYIAAFAAILGHDFPFYLGRGGKGAATTYGILLLNLILFFTFYKLPWQAIFSLFILTISTLLITKAPNITYFIFSIILAIVINYYIRFNIIVLFTYLFLFYIYVISMINIIPKGGFKKELRYLKRDVKIKLVRKILRFFAVLIPLVYFFTTKKATLIFIGIFSLIFVFTEIIRKKKPKLNQNKIISILLKKEEKEKISGITLFAISCFLTILLFEKNIAILAISFLIFGDTIAEIMGLKFGKFKLIGGKTLEGSLACLATCFLIGLIVMKTLNFSFFLVTVAAFATTFIELVPLRIKKFKIDDNFSVALFTAFVVWLIKIIFHNI